MAMAGGWTLLETTLEAVLATSFKRQSVVTLTTHLDSSHRGQLTNSNVDAGSVDVHLSIVRGGETSTTIPESAHPVESPAALNEKEAVCVLAGEKNNGQAGKGPCLCTKKHMHTCVRMCVRGLGSDESERQYQAAHDSFLQGGSIGSYFIWLDVLQGRLLTFIYFKTIT